MPAALQAWIAEPLGLRSLSFGLPPERRSQSPLHYRTGPGLGRPITSISRHVLGLDFERVVDASNSDDFLSAVVPSGNLFGSADEISRFFQMLLDGGTYEGRRVCKTETIRAAVSPVGRLQFDGVLGLPIRLSPGFMLGESPVGLWGARCQQAFGHIGFMTVLCCAVLG